jgi:hypothetical protein
MSTDDGGPRYGLKPRGHAIFLADRVVPEHQVEGARP